MISSDLNDVMIKRSALCVLFIIFMPLYILIFAVVMDQPKSFQLLGRVILELKLV